MNQRAIAQMLQVSQTAVSLVFNQPDTPKVSEKNRRKILDFLEQIDYQYHRKGKTGTIGFLYSTYVSDSAYLNFYERFFSGIESGAKQLGYNMIFEQYKEGFPLSIKHCQLDGLIVKNGIDMQMITREFPNLPVVVINYAETCSPFDVVHPDYYGGIELAIRHLQELGHTRIAYFAPAALHENSFDYDENVDSFRSVCRRRHITVPENFLYQPVIARPEDTRRAVLDALSLWKKQLPRPSAVICLNDYYALLLLKEAGRLGISIPKDLSIIGSDNIPACEFASIPLTSIDNNAVEMGVLSVETLNMRIKSPKTYYSRIACNSTLAIRESVGRISASGNDGNCDGSILQNNTKGEFSR